MLWLRASHRSAYLTKARRLWLLGKKRYLGTSSYKPPQNGENLSPLTDPIGWYSHKLDTNPILTKCVSAGLISGLGQLISQRIMYDPESGKEFRVDWYQTGRFMVLNVIFVAPVLHFWYTWLDKAIPGTQIIPVVKRVFFDEFVFTPVYIPVLMGLLWGMEGNAPAKIPKMIGEEFWNIMIFDWCVYVPVQLVNFRYVPVKYQVLVINVCGVGWNTFVSWRASHQQNKQEEDGEKRKSLH